MSGTEVLNDTDTEKRLMPLYKVLLHNDDQNSFDHVIRSLMQVFSFSLEDSVALTLEAHNNGLVLCKTEPLEHAELHKEQLMSLSLSVSLEPE